MHKTFGHLYNGYLNTNEFCKIQDLNAAIVLFDLHIEVYAVIIAAER